MNKELVSLEQNSRNVGSSVYYGERGNWLIAMAVHRESDCLSKSNFRITQKRLGGLCDDVVIERFNHWAVGWVDYLIINPARTDLIEITNKINEDISNYPVLDETDFSNLEWETANNFWKTEKPEWRYKGWLKDMGLPKSAAKLSLSTLCHRYENETQEFVQRLAE